MRREWTAYEKRLRGMILRATTTMLLVIGVGLANLSYAQWAVNGADINNTNTGKVGIGTTTGSLNIGGKQLLGFNEGGTAPSSNIIGGLGFWGAGMSSGQFHYRTSAYGGLFEFLDVSADAPSTGHASSAYAPVYARSFSSRAMVPDDTTSNYESLFELSNRGAGGQPYYWRMYTAAVGGGAGITPNSYEIWEYPQDDTPHCCIRRFQILASGNNTVIPSSVVIDANGNLGVGTGAPSSKLHVIGDVTVTGNIAAKYQDIAEWVPAQRSYPVGTVLVLDTARANHVRAAVESYDTHVAGVVTGMPGLLLGEAGANKVKVATTGRVKVKVDASAKPVRVGDLLVTGSKPGTAMVSEPMEINGRKFHQPGTILGKALEPLNKGEKDILVLLSLQ